MAANPLPPKMSLFGYLCSEVTRGYVLENDEERYIYRRQKMYTFMKIPRELEKFMSYGFFHCLDSFLFVFTFLPIRFLTAMVKLVFRLPLSVLRLYHGRLLFPAEIIDLLKGFVIGICVYVMSYIDTSMMYHMIKSQSVIKLYLFYNMLEVGDRLFSAFGQDTIDALFWTATEPRGRKREHIGVLAHFLLTIVYVILHTVLVLLQATTLNVAINASNKALLTIMMSNNFVELKGSVFKKFDKNNLFQVSCSDVRERFHLFSLLFIVVVQTMKEYGWKEESFWNLAPDCLMVLVAEFVVDWIKHAFITRFNEVSSDVYKNYTIFLAYDLAQTKQKHAFSDHSDSVSRRMGFIPLPLGVVMIRVIGTAVRASSYGSFLLFMLAYLCLVTFRILASIVILGKACDLIDVHEQKKYSATSSPQKTTSAAAATAAASSSTTVETTSLTSQQQFVVAGNSNSKESTNFATSNNHHHNNISSKEELFCRENSNIATPPDSMPVASSTPPLTSPDVTSDQINLLEAKLQAIVGSDALHISPPTPVLPNSPPEDNLDPIEEEHPLQQPQSVVICKKEGILPHTTTSTNQNQDEGVLGVSEINNAIHPTLTADSAIASESTESGSNTSNNNAGPQHRWSNNRRSQILKQQSIHQGEFNKVVFSDSRRRPLSCTPPSTSLSTSVSIDDEDLTASMASSNPQSANGCGDAVHVAGLVVNQLQHTHCANTQIDDHEPEEETESRPQTEAEIGDEQLVLDQEDHQDQESEGGAHLKHRRSRQLKLSRSLSSPDFMKSYKASFDAERDWPHVDDAEDDDQVVDVVGGGSGGHLLCEEVFNNHHQPREFREVQRELREESLRRGSSADRLRKRKRFDTDRL